MPPLRIGLKLAPQLTTVDELRAVWRIAEEAGFDHLWNFDHFCAIAGDPEGDVLEAWSLLGAMAEATKRVRIGCMVTGNTYRHPGVLAKIAVTVDHLSAGRLEFGIGAAWAEIEHRQFDLEFGTPGRRIARLAEACQICKLLWTQERSSFAGRYYTITDAIANPKPVQKPHPPIWIGGSGERKTLRVVAEHADVWGGGGDPDEAARLSGVLDRHCADVGRDPAEIRRSMQLRFGNDDDDEALRRTQAYVECGFTELIVVVPGGSAEEQGERVARLLPRMRELG